jgi:putative chitinase
LCSSDLAIGGVDTPTELVTAEQFYAIAPQTSLKKLTPLVAPLNVALAKYNITTPLRICHFLAQMYHESDGFNASEEYASGADYEWRDDLGNTQKGDGVRFKGRSFIQITGRYNYQDFSNYLGVDFVSNPELLATPEYAWLGAGWFWDTRNLNNLADQDRFRDITIRINGATNGWSDRLDALQRAKRFFGI